MRTKLLFIIILLLTISEMNAQVSLPYYEGFNYAEGESLVKQNTNGSGVGNALGPWKVWVNNVGAFTSDSADPSIVASPIWTLPTGLPDATGKAIEFTGSQTDALFEFTDQGTTGTIYASFMMNVTDMSAITDAGGAYIFSFSKPNSTNTSLSSASCVFFKRDPANQTSKFFLGISETTSTGVASWSTTAESINTELFIVVSYDIANQISYMWINPASVNGAQPTATLDTSVSDLSSPTSTRYNIIYARLNLDSNAKTPTIVLDEIRIGNTWQSVTGQPALSVSKNNIEGLKIYPNPAKDYITIESKNVKLSSVELYNVLGSKILSQKTLTNNRLNVAGISKGIYMLKVNAEGASTTKKIVID